MHGPGEGGREMNVAAIGARVRAANGRILAQPREREQHVIPQINRPANHPAAVAPEMVIANIGRGQQNFADDPVIQALLHVAQSAQPQPVTPVSSAAADSQSVSLAKLNLAKAREVEIETQFKLYEFAKKHLPEGIEKNERLDSIRSQIFGSPEPYCCVCGGAIAGASLDVSRLACCGTQLHTSCVVQIRSNNCPMCRRALH